MDKREDGGPAFPSHFARNPVDGPDFGLSMRDWLAGQALAGLLADGRADAAVASAQYAYAYADAMLQARAK